ncbi:putative metalloprotease CJM1_0395 family protein [Rheinheimera sp. MMS21-TC3]|uniref:putative metalloprotease CJM1_0395 family protein n=1 Tax=Rheinheimera sp. MMS21-TC3 TaxID=3072790 RepID=UPI0028C4B4A9|nr:putative metalloprotease CJM1_0395 family protein [Rheinheimera sp. MMS21-TC3]WNO59813.1 putative metalloprotease CJM1_0395 family protein [Rheinheimera sp. MMS21-TC3]
MITSHYPNVSINTANPLTEQARRDNSRIDLFTPVKQAEKSSAEKPVVTDEKTANSAKSQPSNNPESTKDTETYQAINPRSKQNSEQDAKKEQQAEAEDKQAEAAELKAIAKLKARDTEVKTHEQAHASVGGSYAAAPSYSYEQGPDGKRYAVGGEVQIDVAPVANDPKATVAKMQQVQAAALAPAQPSSADLAIAAKAAQQAQQARAELTAENSSYATNSKMAKRRELISSFYQQSTLPLQQNPAQTV